MAGGVLARAFGYDAVKSPGHSSRWYCSLSSTRRHNQVPGETLHQFRYQESQAETLHEFRYKDILIGQSARGLVVRWRRARLSRSLCSPSGSNSDVPGHPEGPLRSIEHHFAFR